MHDTKKNTLIDEIPLIRVEFLNEVKDNLIKETAKEKIKRLCASNFELL